MEKAPLAEEDPSSLTSFNFIPEGDEEGLISKFFSKFKTAVSGPSQQQGSSPASSTRTMSIIPSNESGVATDGFPDLQPLLETLPSSSTLTSSSAKTATIAVDNSIAPTSAVTPATAVNNMATVSSSTQTSSSKLTKSTAVSASFSHAGSSAKEIPKSTTATKNTSSDHAIANSLEARTSSSEKTQESIPSITKTHGASHTNHKSPLNKHIVFDEEHNQRQLLPTAMIIPLTKTSSIDSDTQSVMTTFSVSNTNSLSRILNRLRGGEPIDSNKDFWIPDEQCKECIGCNAPFNLFRRKHHCRTCGRIFCSKCLSNNIHTSHSLRVCNDCYGKFIEGYRADDTISLHEGYSYSSVVVDGTLTSSLQQQQQQQQHQLKSSFLIPTSGDDDSSDEELEYDRTTNSFDMQRPLDIHFSQSTSSYHTGSDSEIGIKKLLTNTFLRNTPRSRTSTMNSLGIDTSLATLEGARQQQVNSPMPFRRNSFIVNPLIQNDGGQSSLHQHQQHGDCYDGSAIGEEDDPKRWDKNSRNMLSFWGGERPGSGIFNNIPSFDDWHVDSPASPMMSTSTSTMNKPSAWMMRPPSNERSNNIIRRRLSLSDTMSGTNTLLNSVGSANSSSGSMGNPGSSASSNRHIRVRTKSLMRNAPITTANMMMDQGDNSAYNTNNNGYESSGSGGNTNRNSLCLPLTPSTSTPVPSTTNRSATPDLEQLRAQILSISGSKSHPVAVATHHQWDPSFLYLMRNIIAHLLDEGGLPRADWEEVMMRMLLVIADEVQPHIRIRDTFNMNHYVKVKKVPGGLPRDSFSVSGVVLSKSVAHKGMMRKIRNPSILILNFDVEGFGGSGGLAPAADGTLRQEYLKFDRLLAWEKEHMNALVSEIVGLKPHIVLIAAHAPRTIIEALNKAKIVVAYNIKKQKLDAIARCADATVFNYKNELWNAKAIIPGKCGLFEPLTVMHEYLPNRRKTFLMFHECPKERGATIVLRGGDLRTLAIVKVIMNFMVKVANNINLEAQLRKDFVELRRYNQPTLEDNIMLGGNDITSENGQVADDDSSILHQQFRGANGCSIVAPLNQAEGVDARPLDTQSVSALSIAESQMTVNTMDVISAKKKSQQQYRQTAVVVEDDDICLTAINLVLEKYRNTILSISPGISLPVPHILLKLRESQKKLIGLIRERLGTAITGTTLADSTTLAVKATTMSDPEKHQAGINKSEIVVPPIPTDLMMMYDYFKVFDAYLDHDLEYRHYQDLHLQSWLLFKKYIGGIHQYLSPIYHQQIIVRRTTNPMDNHTIPCEKAVLDPYEYYNPMGDCTLGQYILNSIKDAYTRCSSKMCGTPLIFHDRTYSHGNAQIKVQVFSEDDSGEDELVEERIDLSRDEYLRRIPIFICTHCNLCNISHNWKPMSDLLQRYSFGKFLELLFYQSEAIPLYDTEGSGSPEGGSYFGGNGSNTNSNITGCPHGFYRDHTISFRYQNLSVNFTHAMVQVVEVNPPPLHLRFSFKQQMAMKDEALDSTRSKIAKFFDSIIERNKNFSYDIVQPNLVELCKEYLQELSQEALKNKKSLLQKLQMEYATSAPTDTLQLNNVLVDLQNHAVAWDLKYIDFARRFVRPERELKRLTTNHLRKMFPAESLYNSSSSNNGSSNSTHAVSSLNLRTKRAIEAADLPLLDVELDQETAMAPYGVSGVTTLPSSSEVGASFHYNASFKDQPCLGESPTESYPWFDELKRFDQMFLQDSLPEERDKSSKSMDSYTKERRTVDKKYSTESEITLSHYSQPQRQSSSTRDGSHTKDNSKDEQDMRDLDPSVARRLSLELMKDAPKKKKKEEEKKQQQQKLQHQQQQQQQAESKKTKQQKGKKKQKNYLQESKITESFSTTATPPSTPVPDSCIPPIQSESQSKLMKQAATNPILSSTAYRRLAGFLPDPIIVGKSKSSPSPTLPTAPSASTPSVSTNNNIVASQAPPHTRLLEYNKVQQRKSQLNESANDNGPNKAAVAPITSSTHHTVMSSPPPPPPPVKPAFYRGSPYASKIPERSSIAYRYGFMSGLNNRMPLAERRLGAAGITHPISSALAAANAVQVAKPSTSSSPEVENRGLTRDNASPATNQESSIARPRSRTMAIVASSSSSSHLLGQSSSSKFRVGGHTLVPATKLLTYSSSTNANNNNISTNSTNGSGSGVIIKETDSNRHSHIPVSVASSHHQGGHYHHHHHRKLSEGKLTTRNIRQRLPSKASLEPYTKIKEMKGDDDDDDDSISSSSSSISSTSSLSSDDEEDDGAVLHLDQDECKDSLVCVMDSAIQQQEELECCSSDTEFQYKTFSLMDTDEYDESLGREIVPSILELKQFHREHQVQMSANTLPFLSLESGMIASRKSESLEMKTSSSAMLEAAVLLRSSNMDLAGASGVDWSTSANGRNSIMKAITYVLAEKSINNLTPLEYPFSPNEHIFADSNILVREDEPSSIISYMLGSTFYNEKLQRKQELRMSKADLLDSNKEDRSSEGKPFFSEMFPETDEREKPWRFSFQGGSTSFSCKIYFAEQFDMLRKSCGCDEIFISSLARCTPWDTAGGKSGSIFLKTKDERFLIKQISKYEMDAFLGSANKYFLYMFNEVFDKGIPTVLSKIFGLYRIGFYNNASGKSMKMDILVMENLFYDTSVKKVYDLKGSMRNRYAEKTGRDVEVFLDENFVEIISKTPMYMRVDTKCNLSDSLYNDTHFLLSLDVMDYSLLVGFDEESNEIIVGIVDFIRTFTWDKKLESWVKESGMLGGGKKDPTIVSPRMYRKRFRSAIDLYFCMIPDFWTHKLD